jgi:hypothetical protein
MAYISKHANTMQSVRLKCSKLYQRFPGDSIKDDVRIFDCTERNYYGIMNQMIEWGWEVEILPGGELEDLSC